MKFTKQIRSILFFLIGSLTFILAGLSLLWFNSKTEFHISLNVLHNKAFDLFFANITHVGDGIFVVIVLLFLGIFTFTKYRWSYFALGFGTFIVSGIIVQVLKHLIFPDAHRPLLVIGEENLNLVENVTMHQHNSFPSGHATAAFSLFIVLAYAIGNGKKGIQALLLFLAILVSYSRVYLSQHFLEDIIAGAAIALISFIITIGTINLSKLKI